MSVELLLLFSVGCFIIVGAIYFLAYGRGKNFLNSSGKTGSAGKPKDQVKRSTELKATALKEIAKAKARLAPGSGKSTRLLQALGESDPKLLVEGVKKWLSEEGGGRLKK